MGHEGREAPSRLRSKSFRLIFPPSRFQFRRPLAPRGQVETPVPEFSQPGLEAGEGGGEGAGVGGLGCPGTQSIIFLATRQS